MTNPTIRKAIEVYGIDKQMMKCIEEMSELTKAICKFWQAKTEEDTKKKIRDMQEETADCFIMLEQMKLMVGAKDVNEFIQKKLERLENRLEQEKEDDK